MKQDTTTGSKPPARAVRSAILSESLPPEGRMQVLTAYAAPLEERWYPLPTDLEPESALMTCDATTLCGTDVHLWQGDMAGYITAPLPYVLGHEVCGRIVGLGEGRHRDSFGQPLEIGDRLLRMNGNCGRCYNCTLLHLPNHCVERDSYMVRSPERWPHFIGGLSEYSYVFPTATRLRVPEDVSTALAATASCAGKTAIHAFEWIGRVSSEDTVVVQGAGPVGLFCTAIAAALGAGRVITVGAPDARLELARRLGADVTVSISELPDSSERVLAVKDNAGPRGVSIVIEASGATTALAEGLAMVGVNARYHVLGQVDSRPVEIPAHLIPTGQTTITGSLAGDIGHLWKTLEFISKHPELPFDDMLDTEFGLSEATDALGSMRSHSSIKPTVLCSSE